MVDVSRDPDHQTAYSDSAPHDVAHLPVSRLARIRGYAVHAYTASGILPAYFATAEIIDADCDPRWVFFWLLVAVGIDATDGPLARAWHVKSTAAAIDGRTIDDLLDYLTFAFIPLLLVARMHWIPAGTEWTVAIAMGASLWGFAHVKAKEEEAGFFRGFPSYWNIFAFYAGLLSIALSPWCSGILLWTLTIATVSPMRMVYPNLTPHPWRMPVLAGVAIWTLIMLAMLWSYPDSPLWLITLSLIYPVFYTLLSIHLDLADRARRRTQP